MKSVPAMAAGLCVLLGLSACELDGGAPPLPPNAERDAVHAAVPANQFAMDLYAQLREEEGNLFFSPYSVSSALAMTWAGARGETAAELAEVLHFHEPEDTVHAGFRALNALVNAPSDAMSLRVANALWGQWDYPFRQDYLDLVLGHYGGALESVDFAGDTEGARRTINAWVEEKTEDRIEDLIPQGAVDPLTRLVLTNAIYFKGSWAHEFDPDQTRDEPFHLLDGQEIQVPRMQQTETFPYTQTDTLQAVLLPYEGGDVSMLVLLPREVDGLPALEDQLDLAALDTLTGEMRPQEVRLGLPRFETSSEFSMSGVLREMGAAGAFHPSTADFSGMTESPEELYIDEVIHKAFVEVNEEGTVAAAATGVVARTVAMPTEFIVDRPFLFLLRHEPTGAILFLGRIMDPRE